MIVVDTSVLIDLFRGHITSPVNRLKQLERDQVPYAIPAVCCQELLQGAKDEREWSLLEQYLETQEILLPEDPWKTHVAAARLYYTCRRQGITVRSTIDCLIAQLTIEHDGSLLHDDADYEKLRAVSPLRTLSEQ